MIKKIFVYSVSCCFLFVLLLFFRSFHTYHVDSLNSDYTKEFMKLEGVKAVDEILVYENRGFATLRLYSDRLMRINFKQHRNSLDYLLNRKPVFYQKHDDNYRVHVDSINEYSTGCDVELLHEKGADYGVNLGYKVTIYELLKYNENIYELFSDWVAHRKDDCQVVLRSDI